MGAEDEPGGAADKEGNKETEPKKSLRRGLLISAWGLIIGAASSVVLFTDFFQKVPVLTTLVTKTIFRIQTQPSPKNNQSTLLVEPPYCPATVPLFSCENGGDFVVSNVLWDDPDHGLWIRSSPTASSLTNNKVHVLPSNATGVFVGKCKDGWCPAKCGAWQGYSGQSYLAYRPDAYRRMTGIQPGESVPIYTGPDSTCPRVEGSTPKVEASIPFGAENVVVHSCQPSPRDASTYCEVTYGEKWSGWVQGRYLKPLPDGFVYLRDQAPTVVQDIRYAGSHNFVGRSILSYDAAECVLTQQAAQAVESVQQALSERQLALVVWDCYRPARAVRQFVDWASDATDIVMKAEFYPDFDKTQLIATGYISSPSAHSRGSTVDVGLLPVGTKDVPQSEYIQLKPCAAPQGERFADGTVDLGTEFDCFDSKANFDNTQISDLARTNRSLLRKVMMDHGFKPIQTEWWHFELIKEPFPYRTFDFRIPARHPDQS